MLVVAILAHPIGVPPLAAQTLLGTVREATTREPIPSVVVQLVGDRDSVLARTTSAADGRFSFINVAVGVPANAKLRLRKIGFRALELPLPHAETVELSLERLPAMLQAIVSTATPGCRDNETSPRARELWRDARAAWLGGLGPGIDPTGGLLVKQPVPGAPGAFAPVTLRTASTSHSFATARVALEHYIVAAKDAEDRRQRPELVASPDSASDDVLLDPSFPATHCLRIERGNDEHRGEVALHFEIPKNRRTPIDAEGRLWLDTTNAILRSIEFEYPMPRVRNREPARGRAVFEQAASGVPVVTRWGLHLEGALRRPAKGVRIILPPGTSTANLRDTIDASALATWDSAAAYEGSLPHLVGRVFNRATGKGMRDIRLTAVFAAARVRPGVERRTTFTDSLGNFDLELPGPTIVLRATDTTLADFRAPTLGPQPDYDWKIELPLRGSVWDPPPLGAFIGVGASFDHDEHTIIKVSSTVDILREACQMKARDSTVGIVVGRIDSSLWQSTAAQPKAFLRARWHAPNKTGRDNDVVREILSDSTGAFWVCGVPRGQPVALTLLPDTAGTAMTITTAAGLFTPVVLGPHPRSSPPNDESITAQSGALTAEIASSRNAWLLHFSPPTPTGERTWRTTKARSA